MQSLNKKPAKHDMQWDKFGELSDLSVDDDKKPLKSPATTAGSSKFIKKKKAPQSPASTTQKPAQTPSTASDAISQSALGNVHARCSALGKAESFAAKYSAARGATGKVSTLSSDSDLELSLSPDEDVLADLHAVKHLTAAAGDVTGRQMSYIVT